MRRGAAFLLAMGLAGLVPGSLAARPPRIGTSTPAYYSWVSVLLAGVPAEVVPLLPDGADLHGYQPKPEDVAALAGLDLLVANGLGHDAYLEPMLRAIAPRRPPTVDLHRGVPLIPLPGATGAGPGAANPHSFLALTAAVQQIHNLAGDLVKLVPEHAEVVAGNLRDFSRRLRRLRSETVARLADAPSLTIATVHDGYGYLFQELGLEVALVLQPRHGIEPSAREMADLRDRLGSVAVLFVEAEAPRGWVDNLAREAGVRTRGLHHLSRGAPRPDGFELAMKANCDAIVAGLLEPDRAP